MTTAELSRLQELENLAFDGVPLADWEYAEMRALIDIENAEYVPPEYVTVHSDFFKPL